MTLLKKVRQKFNHVLVMRQKYILEKNPDELDLLLETFKLKTHDIPDDNVNSLFGENKKNGSCYCNGPRFVRC